MELLSVDMSGSKEEGKPRQMEKGEERERTRVEDEGRGVEAEGWRKSTRTGERERRGETLKRRTCCHELCDDARQLRTQVSMTLCIMHHERDSVRRHTYQRHVLVTRS